VEGRKSGGDISLNSKCFPFVDKKNGIEISPDGGGINVGVFVRMTGECFRNAIRSVTKKGDLHLIEHRN